MPRIDHEIVLRLCLGSALLGGLSGCGEVPGEARSEIDFELTFESGSGKPLPPEKTVIDNWRKRTQENFERDFGQFETESWFEPLVSLIRSGTPTSDFPAVGQLVRKGSLLCSGTLLSCSQFVTASHCFEIAGAMDLLADNYEVFFLQHPEAVQVISIEPYCSSPECNEDVHDLAIAELVAAPPFEPHALAQPDDWDTGETVSIVGFGPVSSVSVKGIKNAASLVPVRCTHQPCFELGPDTDKGLCPADSGGPMFTANSRILGLASIGHLTCGSAIGRWADTTYSPNHGWLADKTSCTGTVGISPPFVAYRFAEIEAGDRHFWRWPDYDGDVTVNLNFGQSEGLYVSEPAGSECRYFGTSVNCKLSGDRRSITIEYSGEDEAFYQIMAIPAG